VDNLFIEGESLGKIILDKSSTPEMAYGLCFAALVSIRQYLKKTGVNRENIEHLRLQATSSAHKDEFNKRLDSLEGVYEQDPVDQAAYTYYREPLIESLRNINENLVDDNLRLSKKIQTLESTVASLESSLRSAKEKNQALSNQKDREVQALSKEVRSLEHRLIEMERDNLFRLSHDSDEA